MLDLERLQAVAEEPRTRGELARSQPQAAGSNRVHWRQKGPRSIAERPVECPDRLGAVQGGFAEARGPTPRGCKPPAMDALGIAR